MSPSSGFWPNFMTSPTSYPHPTYLPTSPNEYSDWMHHHHHTYRSPYSTNVPMGSSSSSTGTSNMSNNHLHPIGSPNSNSPTMNTNNGRYHHHHHTASDMDVMTAAIGVAAAAQMFHHDKQSHHAYTPASHHFDYHLGGSMMAGASYGFPTQSKSNRFTLAISFVISLWSRFRSDGFGHFGYGLREFGHERSDQLITVVFKPSFTLSIIAEHVAPWRREHRSKSFDFHVRTIDVQESCHGVLDPSHHSSSSSLSLLQCLFMDYVDIFCCLCDRYWFH